MHRVLEFSRIGGPLLALSLILASSASAEDCGQGCIRFVALGDFGDTSGSSKEANVAHLINQVLCPEFIISLGDNNYADPPLSEVQYQQRVGGYYSNYGADVGSQSVQSTRGQVCPSLGKGAQFYTSPGNHDDDTKASTGQQYDTYRAYFTNSSLPAGQSDAATPCSQVETEIRSWLDDPSYECPTELTNDGASLFYDFERGPVHFFSLNSNCEQTMSAGNKGCYDENLACTPYGSLTDPCAKQYCGQLLWMAYVSSISTAPWQIVFFHHPPYSTGDHGSCKGMRYDYYAAGIDLVLTGHHHAFENTLLKADDGSTLAYIVNGLGGTSASTSACKTTPSAQDGYQICSSWTYEDHHGAMVIEASKDTLETEFFYTRGASNDYLFGPISSCLIRRDGALLESLCGYADSSEIEVCCDACGSKCG